MSDTTTTAPLPFVGSGRNGTLTESEARTLLDEQARSGLAFADFARSRQISRQRLSWWKAKFAGRHVDRSAHAARKRTASPRAPRFVPVVPAAPALTRRTAPTAAVVTAPRAAYELALGGALTLRIPHDFHDATLARLVRVLQEAR